MAAKYQQNVILDRFDDAIAHAERLRRLMPAVYNPSRVNELPIPPVMNVEPEDNGHTNNDQGDTDEINELNESAETEENHELSEQNITLEALKVEPFQQVAMESADLNAVEYFFAEGNEELNETLEEPPNSDPSEGDTSDDDIEFTYESLDDFRPMIEKDGYEIKAHDILSDNIPFKTNVRFYFNVRKTL